MSASEQAQRDVVAHSFWNGRVALCSGALAELLKANRIWTADFEDSRCVIGSVGSAS